MIHVAIMRCNTCDSATVLSQYSDTYIRKSSIDLSKMTWHVSCSVMNMKIALTRSHHRIAPLFDSATNVELYETQGYKKETEYVGMHTCERGAKDAIDTLISMKINVVICGAISSEYEQLLLLHHIDLYSYISGDVDEVLQGWKMGNLHTRYFSMPGCEHPRYCCHKGTVRRCRNRANRREV